MRAQFSVAAGLALIVSLNGNVVALGSDEESSLVKQGEYIAHAADCMACHVGPDGTPLAGGKPVPTPLGDIIGTNISSSKKYGIGDYSLEDFSQVLKEGKTPSGRHLYPAMPYPAYRGMTDDDIKALYAYWQTVPAVEQAPEAQTDLDFPFNVRLLMIGWKLVNLDDEEPSSTANDQLARGQYLVDTLAHCGTCHTPRDATMGSDDERYLGGAQLDQWYAPNITSDEIAGIGGWSNEQLADYFKNGQAGYLAHAAGPMSEAVHYSLQYLTKEDHLAIASYLKTVPAIGDNKQTQPVMAREGDPQLAKLEPVVTKATSYPPDELEEHGLKTADISNPGSAEGLYVQHCAACHRADGFGQPASYYANLNGNTALRSANPRNLVAVIVNGVALNGATPRPLMPGFEDQLSSRQIADVANYVRTEFGGYATSSIDADQVDYIISGKQPVSDLIRYAPLFAWLGIGVVVLLLIVGTWIWWRRRQHDALSNQ